MVTRRTGMGHRKVFALLLTMAAIGAASTFARDIDQTDHNSPEVKAWVLSLKNGPGVACCATADGWRPQEVEWDVSRKGYRVMIEGHWVDVPDETVIHGPNKLGHAEVWYYHVNGLPAVRCFLPGEGM
jgi:hypothetical protein